MHRSDVSFVLRLSKGTHELFLHGPLVLEQDDVAA
jgi:hypothetical protein